MAKKKSNKSLWVMLALIAVIIAVILLLPGCGSRNARKSAETKTEATTLVGAGETAPGFTVELTEAAVCRSKSCAARSCCSTSGPRGARPAARS